MGLTGTPSMTSLSSRCPATSVRMTKSYGVPNQNIMAIGGQRTSWFTWNGRAAFPSRSRHAQSKLNYLGTLLKDATFGFLQEAHGGTEHIKH
eukprot:10170484-Karenia_brevis.AAC.1